MTLRYLRALTLTVHGQSVSGGAERHWIGLDHDTPTCDCGDHLWNDTLCKHQIAYQLHHGDIAQMKRLTTVLEELLD